MDPTSFTFGGAEMLRMPSAAYGATSPLAFPDPKRTSLFPREVAFLDRRDAGKRLGEELRKALPCTKDVVVIGIPRGGMAVAAEVAAVLGAPLTYWVAQKLCTSAKSNRALGALAEDGEMYVDEESLRAFRVPATHLVDEVRLRRREVAERLARYQAVAERPDVADKTVILVDDGMATGYTMQVALRGVKRLKAAKIILAAPVAPATVVRGLCDSVDAMTMLHTAMALADVAQFYVHFRPVTDEEVLSFLHDASAPSDVIPSAAHCTMVAA